MFTGYQSIIIYWFVLTFIHFSIIPITKISLKLPKMLWIPIYVFHLCSLMGYAMRMSDSN